MILVTGADGQLGFDVAKELSSRGLDFIATDITALDITDKASVEAVFESNPITAVIHCAAFTAVDKAEEQIEQCFKVNFEGTVYLAKAARKVGAKFLFVSTDYVFGGKGDSPLETNQAKNPENIYGKSKLAAEKELSEITDKLFIVRTSWVFGERNTNFIYTMLKLSKAYPQVRVVNDQTGSPTYSKHLARLLCDMIVTEKFGIYHARNEGFCTWAQFAQEIFELAKKDTQVIPVSSEEYKTAAKRPENSRLSLLSLEENGFKKLPHYKEALKEYLKNIKEI